MAALNSHAKDLARFWQGRILWDSPMAQYSTLKVGGPAEAIVPVRNTAELERLLPWLHKNNIDWRVVGRGSNILVPDSGLAGVIIMLEGEFKTIEKVEPPQPTSAAETVFIRAGGGCRLARLVSFCITESLTGLEFSIGIPGSIGGAIAMNAGAWGGEIGGLVAAVDLMDGSGRLYTAAGDDLGFSYRQWSMGPDTVLLSATFGVKPGRRDTIKASCRKYQDMRRRQQPVGEASAGSFFKNPPADSAGRLIEAAGLKGFAVGGAKVSEKHANFIINTGRASAADILTLMQIVQQEVYKRFGIRLEPEVHILAGE